MTENDTNQTSRLARLQQLLRNRRGRFPEIAEKSGVELKWLYGLANGDIANPGIDRFDRVYDFIEAEIKAESKGIK